MKKYIAKQLKPYLSQIEAGEVDYSSFFLTMHHIREYKKFLDLRESFGRIFGHEIGEIRDSLVKARAAKDYALADGLKKTLEDEYGISVQIYKDGDIELRVPLMKQLVALHGSGFASDESRRELVRKHNDKTGP